MKVIHENENYMVVLPDTPEIQTAYDHDGNPVDGNYEVLNKLHNVVEYRGINLPTALTVAEHYNSILTQKLYQNPEEALFVQLGADDDTGGGGLLN